MSSLFVAASGVSDSVVDTLAPCILKVVVHHFGVRIRISIIGIGIDDGHEHGKFILVGLCVSSQVDSGPDFLFAGYGKGFSVV